MRVLVADDDRVSAEVLSRTLIPLKFDVKVVRDGAQAWDALREFGEPSLAILDWMMPFIDGPDVCRLVRQEPNQAPTYLILLTSRQKREDVVEGLDAGADDYLIKPFDPSELMARVRVGRRVLDLQQGLAARVKELQEALAQVKQLSGLLPICSYCKSIRSDKNYWQQVDTYLMQHADAKFTHSICPTCFATISKELDEYAKGKEPGKHLLI
jgi:phosphoserine phosphatase RsbU/P